MGFPRLFGFNRDRARSGRPVDRRRVRVGRELAGWALELGRLEERVLLSGVPTGFTSVGVGGGGALFSPSFDPFNPNEIYISSDMGQIFHTTNAGATWNDLDFRQVQGGHESAVQVTNDPNMRYTIDYANSDGGGQGTPSVSTDGGRSWTPLANDPTAGSADKLFVDPDNANWLIVSDYNDIYFSSDGGQSWKNEFSGDVGGAGLHLAGAFWDGNTIYVGSNTGLFVSSNGGNSFQISTAGGIPGSQAMISFSGAKEDGVTRLFAVTWNRGDVFEGVQGYDYAGIPQGSQSIYTLTVGQGSWVRTMSGIGTSVVPIFVSTALDDINTAYVAGGSSPSGPPTVYKTTDGGQTWQNVFLTSGNQNINTGWQGAGGDHNWSYAEVALGFQVDPTDVNTVIITDYGFAHLSTDGGSTWNQLYVAPADQNPANSPTPRNHAYDDSGLDNTTAWGVNWVDSDNVLIANSDITGSHSTDGGKTFAFGSGNNYNSTYMTVTDPSTGIVYAATSSIHDIYESTHLTDASIDGGTGGILFSTDKGATWQATNFPVNKPVVWLAVDPNHANRMYASVANVSSNLGGIYVSNNINLGAGATWTKLNNPPRTQGHPFDIRVLNDGTLVVTFSGRRGGNPINFTDSSGVFTSKDGGQTWIDVSAPSMHYWTMDLVIDPSDPNQSTWYVGVYSGWGGPSNGLGGLYRTTNRGATWTQISSESRVTSVTFNPDDPDELWMTTETDGLWYSDNIQSSDPELDQVTTYPFRQPERVFYNPYDNNEIWVTSFGSGVMVGSVLPGLQNVTKTNLKASANPAVYGQSVTFTATVDIINGEGGPPTGSVTFKDGSIFVGTGIVTTVDGVTTATFTTSGMALGTHSIVATYHGDNNDTPSSSPALSLAVGKDKTKTTLAATIDSPVFGTPEEFIATVSVVAPGAGDPHGKVTFKEGSTILGTGTLADVQGAMTATFTTTALGIGAHSITAVYGGDGTDLPSTSEPLALLVDRDRTKTSLLVSVAAPVFGQAEVFTATVAVLSPGSGTPTGKVTFKDGTTVLGTGSLALVKGIPTATFTTSSLAVGTHPITAVYGGDARNQGSASPARSLKVSPDKTKTTIAASVHPPVFGQKETFTATVHVLSPGAGLATGTVTFKDGSTILGTGTLATVKGVTTATFSTSALAVGTHAITAVYAGDQHDLSSTSGTLPLTVNKRQTRTTIRSSINPAVLGTAATFTATVSIVSPGAGHPTGTVTFKDGSTVLGTGTLATVNGVTTATFSTSALGVGTHAITAVYAGDARDVSSTSGSLPQMVNKTQTRTTIKASANPVVHGLTITFTATVTDLVPGTDTPIGIVTFRDGSTTLGTGTLVTVDGVTTATFQTSSLAVGSHAITVLYIGDSKHKGSSSGTLMLSVS